MCVNDEDLTEHTDGKYYCLFHLPEVEGKKEKFEKKFKERIQKIEASIKDSEKKDEETTTPSKEGLNYDFRYVYFPAEINFSKYNFKTSANFSIGNIYVRRLFQLRQHLRQHAYFSSATFTANADFSSATFTADADFRSATFEEKSQIFFIRTKFLGKLNFNYTNFKGYLAFEGTQDNRLFTGENALLDLQNARIDDAKKISFHTVRLEPHWFVNTDASEFVFTDCQWNYADGKPLNVKTELRKLKDRGFENPNALLTKACWQLAENHEESKSFAESSEFRKIANESRRLQTPWHPFRKKFWNWQPFTLHWWYYAVSFYGENWRRAFFVLLGILLVSGIFYEWFGNFQSTDPLELYYNMTNGEGYIHSLAVASFQRPEPKPADILTKGFVVLETIFAPLQAALLALAIRRKFMR